MGVCMVWSRSWKALSVICLLRVLKEKKLPIADDHRREHDNHPEDAVHQDAKWPGPWRVGHSVMTRSEGAIKDKGEGSHNVSRN